MFPLPIGAGFDIAIFQQPARKLKYVCPKQKEYQELDFNHGLNGVITLFLPGHTCSNFRHSS